MSTESMAKGILAGLRSLGVVIEGIEEDRSRIIYISVPEFSDIVDSRGNEMSGYLLIKRVRNKLKSILPGLSIEGKVRKGEIWTYEDKSKIMAESKGPSLS